MSRFMTKLSVAIFAITLSVAMLCGAARHVQAAAPRVEKIKQLTGPHGEKLWLEKFYGASGLFGMQLKNTAGGVVAYAPLAPYNGVFCPSLQTCLVFPNGALQFFAPGWRLDTAHVNYDAANAVAQVDGGTNDATRTDYQSYLQYDTVTAYSGPELGTPDRRLGAEGFVRANSLWWGIASVAFILPDSPLFYVLLLITGFGIVKMLQRRKRRRARAMANAMDATSG